MLPGWGEEHGDLPTLAGYLFEAMLPSKLVSKIYL